MTEASSRPTEAQARRELRQRKALALGALAAAAAGFVGAHLAGGPDAGFGLGLFEAVCEAALVGGLADWYAVTALFRRPLGLPIPHTAVIPENKDRIGGALARFVRDNFLSPESVRAKVEEVDVAEIVGQWLRDPRNSRRVATDAIGAVQKAAAGLDDDRVQAFLHDNVVEQLRRAALAPQLSQGLLALTRDDRHEALLDELLSLVSRTVAENREAVQEAAHTVLPAYLPDFLKDRLGDRAAAAVADTLVAMLADRDHGLRQQVHVAMGAFVDRLRDDEGLQREVDAVRDRLLAHPGFRAFVGGRWADLKGFVLADLMSERSEIRERIERGGEELGRAILSDPAFQDALNEKVRGALVHLAEHHGDAVRELIESNVRSWNPAEMTDRIELNVGKDLQYIRLSGTLVGGLVGGLIYLAVSL